MPADIVRNVFISGLLALVFLTLDPAAADEPAPPPFSSRPAPTPSAPTPPATGTLASDRTAVLNQVLPSECLLGYAAETVTESPDERFATLRKKRKVIINCVRQAETASQDMSASVIDMTNQLSDRKQQLNDYKFGPDSLPPLLQLEQWIQSDSMEIEKLTGELAAAKSATVPDEGRIRDLEGSLREIGNRQKADQQRVDNYQALDQEFNDEIKARQDAIDGFQKDIERKKADQKILGNTLYMMGRDLDETDNEISQLTQTTTDNNEYKTNISIAFTILVGVVIIGFFFIAYRTPDISREIFSSESGIQFITLFSLVIAIILFGVIGVLEGKELAALLAGLSGYILGRANSGKPQPQNPQPQNPPPQPQA